MWAAVPPPSVTACSQTLTSGSGLLTYLTYTGAFIDAGRITDALADQLRQQVPTRTPSRVTARTSATPTSRTVNGPPLRLLPARSPRIYYFSNVTAERTLNHDLRTAEVAVGRIGRVSAR